MRCGPKKDVIVLSFIIALKDSDPYMNSDHYDKLLLSIPIFDIRVDPYNK